MSGTVLILAFVISMAFLFVSIMKFKMHPFFSMVISGALAGMICGMDIVTIVGYLTSGLGGVMTSIGLLIILGCLIGNLLAESGATDSLASKLCDVFGNSKSSLAMNITGFITSIPVYWGTAFIILNPMLKTLSKKTKKSIQVYVTALTIGLIVTHCLVIPTPGPLAVAGTLGANLGWFIFYSLIIAALASLVGGWIYGEWLGKKQYPYNEAAEETDSAEQEKTPANIAPAGKALFLILLPLLLIVIGTVTPLVSSNATVLAVAGTLSTGQGVVALAISAIVGLIMLRKNINKPISKIVTETISFIGDPILVLCAGGAYGAVVSATGIGNYLGENIASWNVSIILLAFLFTAIMRTALGSPVVGMVTCSSILAPIITSLGASPVIVGLAICAGSIPICAPNDPCYWMIKDLSGIPEKDVVKTFTVGGVIASLISLAIIFLLQVCRGFLPGLG